MNAALSYALLFFPATFLLCFLKFQVINKKMPPTHISRQSSSPHHCVFLLLSHSLSLSHSARSTVWIITEKPAELYSEFIVIQLRFLNSHIISTDSSHCKTLSERTDHLRPYRRLLSSLPLSLKVNRWNCSYVHRQLARSAHIYYHTGYTDMQ